MDQHLSVTETPCRDYVHVLWLVCVVEVVLQLENVHPAALYLAWNQVPTLVMTSPVLVAEISNEHRWARSGAGIS